MQKLTNVSQNIRLDMAARLLPQDNGPALAGLPKHA